MRLAIVGVGAMGCLFAGRLAPLVELTMVGHWSEQIARLNEAGLTLIEMDERETHRSLRVTDDVSAVAPVALALILVKSYQTEQAAQIASQVLAEDGLALTLQNGLGNLETLAAVLGSHRVAQGVTSQAATLVAPGIVRHAGEGPVHLARTPDTAGRLETVASLFCAAGFDAYLSDSVEGLIWGKLAVNAGINPLTALLDVPNGVLLDEEWTRQIMVGAAEEVATVARALGIELPYASAAEQVTQVALATAANSSSMRQDLQRGAPTEIEAICGAVVRYGEQVSVPTPINAWLLRLIRAVIG